jgi:hypothetical protein
MFGDGENSENYHMDENFVGQLEGCRVPGTKHEYFDCCFSLSASTCRTFGTVNLFLLLLMTLVFLRLLFKSKWFRYNRLLLFTFLFQFAALIFRVVYMFSVGYQGKPKLAYFLVKQGGPADSVLALIAFLCYIELISAKYDQKDDPEFNQLELKSQYSRFYFQTVVGFAVYWGILFAFSYQRSSLIEIELGCSLAMLILGILYWVAGGGLILTI